MIQSAFVDAVASVLRFHSASLQNLEDSIRKRRLLDASPDEQEDQHRPISIIEVVVHTEDVQKQIHVLASICGRNPRTASEIEVAEHRLLPGVDLISQLYQELLEADDKTGSMLR